MGTDLVAPAIGAGVFGMLVALFTLSMRAILSTGERSDDRFEAELARKDADLVAARADAREWRERYLALVEGRRT